MKTVIIYTSLHQGNTKRLVESLAHNNIDIIDILSNKDADISEYDCIGIASGIAYGKKCQKIKWCFLSIPQEIQKKNIMQLQKPLQTIWDVRIWGHIIAKVSIHMVLGN